MTTEAEIEAAKAYLDEAATSAGRELTPKVIIAGMLDAAARVRHHAFLERTRAFLERTATANEHQGS